MKFFDVWIFVTSIMIVAGAVTGTIALMMEYLSDNNTMGKYQCVEDIWFLIKIIGCFLLLTIKISAVLYIIVRVIWGDTIVM